MAMLRSAAVAKKADAQRKPSELRGKLLTDQTIQIVLSGLIEGSVDRIEPIFNSDRMPRYVIVENVARIDPSEARSLLERMDDAGIVRKTFYEIPEQCC